MTPDNIIRAGQKLNRLFGGRSGRSRLGALKTSVSPTKIFYLWEKHTLKRIELFSME